MSHYFFNQLILGARAEIQKKIGHFLVQMKTLKFASEIYWPLWILTYISKFVVYFQKENIESSNLLFKAWFFTCFSAKKTLKSLVFKIRSFGISCWSCGQRQNTYVKFNQTNCWSGKFTCIWKTVMKNFVFSMAVCHRDFFQNIWEFCLCLKISLSIGFFDLVDICWNYGRNQQNNEDWDGCYWKLQNELWHIKATELKLGFVILPIEHPCIT